MTRVPGHGVERACRVECLSYGPASRREDHREKTMKIQELIKTQSELLWRFMGFFQSPFLRVLHALVVPVSYTHLTLPTTSRV